MSTTRPNRPADPAHTLRQARQQPPASTAPVRPLPVSEPVRRCH
ncbi:hypothetical protein [Nocardia cyriacigeorgica]|nr:hypothetical protein [Nocardia cyriacigeorgica]